MELIPLIGHLLSFRDSTCDFTLYIHNPAKGYTLSRTRPYFLAFGIFCQISDLSTLIAAPIRPYHRRPMTPRQICRATPSPPISYLSADLSAIAQSAQAEARYSEGGSSARRRAASVSSPCMTAYSSNASSCCLRVLVCLPVCGFVSGNRARPRETADYRVLATARRIHIRLRVAVLRYSSRFRGFRPALAQNKAAQCTLGNWANGACVRLSLRGKARLLPRAASTVRSAILRRRNTAFSSRARPLAHHANRSLAVPLRSFLTHAPLARPSAMARFSS